MSSRTPASLTPTTSTRLPTSTTARDEPRLSACRLRTRTRERSGHPACATRPGIAQNRPGLPQTDDDADPAPARSARARLGDDLGHPQGESSSTTTTSPRAMSRPLTSRLLSLAGGPVQLEDVECQPRAPASGSAVDATTPMATPAGPSPLVVDRRGEGAVRAALVEREHQHRRGHAAGEERHGDRGVGDEGGQLAAPCTGRTRRRRRRR